MELEKIRNLSDDELKGQQNTAAEQLFRIRFQKSLGTLAAEKAASPAVAPTAPPASTRTARKKAKA
jgi:large subunit ribosomal protein L29